MVVAVVLAVGWLGLASTAAGELTIGEPAPLVVLLVMLGVVHLALTVDGRRRDQVLLPVVGLLMGLSLLLMSRLPQDLVVQRLGRLELLAGLGMQLLWIGLSLAIAALIAVGLRNDLLLRSYKYTWAVAGIALLLLVFVLGEETNGARLTLRIGPFAGQPSELLKIILVVFLAAYLADNRALLAGRDSRLGPLRLPPLPYLLPMLVMWGLALAIVVVQRDLGAALLFYGVFLLLLYVATQRRDLLASAWSCSWPAGSSCTRFFPHVQDRVAHLARPLRHGPGRRLPGHPRPLRARPRRRPGHRPRRRPARPSAARRPSPPSTPTSSSPPWARSSAWPAAWPSSRSTRSSPSAACASRPARATSSGRCWRPG